MMTLKQTKDGRGRGLVGRQIMVEGQGPYRVTAVDERGTLHAYHVVDGGWVSANREAVKFIRRHNARR